MSFATAQRRFAAQAARHLGTLRPVTVQPYTGTGYATADGSPLSVFLSAVRTEREITPTGFVVVHTAELRVVKTARWQPAEGVEFVRTDTSERFRCRTAVGAHDAFAAEIVCSVVRLNP